MPFEWSKVGAAPAADVLEVSVMGPGFGESIVCHIGGNEWIIVDSCIEPKAKRPAPLLYLEAIGVNPASAVKLVLATHWDQDHIRGLGEVVETCVTAEFSCANAFLKDEFQYYIDEILIGNQDRGAKDIQQAFQSVKKSGRIVKRATPGRALLRRQAANQPSVVLWSLSPSDKEHDLFLQEIADVRPSAGEPMRQAIARTPNLASVVSLLVIDDCAVLLGADMETKTDADRGWNAVIDEHAKLMLARAGLVKIPHHGSKGAHHDGMWNDLLETATFAVIAPFGRGESKGRPPTDDDLQRIRALASKLYVTARHTTTKPPARNPTVTRGLREGNIQTRSLSKSLGLVRLRKAAGGEWQPELFGPAFEVQMPQKIGLKPQ